VEVYGTVDELNAAIGRALASGCVHEIESTLLRVQSDLFCLGSDLCFLEGDKKERPAPRIEQRHVDGLEASIDNLARELDPLRNFILPGGSRTASDLHIARTICRRAERLAVALESEEEVGQRVVNYLNRLSDLLFMAARVENRRNGVEDVVWDGKV
jgi:cob(I)alamin adenosyltransferase